MCIRTFTALLLLVGSALFYAPVAHSVSDTLEIRNTSPLAQIFGLPAMRGKRAEGWQARFNVDVANSFTGGSAPSEFVFLDGETAVFSYTVRRGFAERFEFGIELPWVVHSGGRFDGLIDEFHDLFGLPDGGRPLTDRGELDYLVALDGQQQVGLQSKNSDIGDIRGWLGLSLVDAAQRSLVGRLQAKLPTGSAANLSGSGASDVALGFDYLERGVFERLGVQLSIGAGIAVLGKGDVAGQRQKTWVPYGHFGLVFRADKRLRLIGQLDSHGALFDARLSHLGDAVLQGTLGVQYRMTPKVALELALVEDLKGAMGADAIFKLTLSGAL